MFYCFGFWYLATSYLMMSNVFLLSLGITAGVKKMSVLNIRDNFVLSLTYRVSAIWVIEKNTTLHDIGGIVLLFSDKKHTISVAKKKNIKWN